MNIVIEITSHRHPMEMFAAVFEAVLCFHMGHLFMGDSNDFAPDVGSFIDYCIGKIWTVSTVILLTFRKKSVNEYLNGRLGVLADDVIEKIRGCGFRRLLYHLPLRC